MASLTLRTLTRPGDHTKNAPLTNAEVDTNFINLDADLELRAPIDSPEFTGVPTAPTAPLGTNTTQLATTEFVARALEPANSGVDSRAPIDSPALTGMPTAPTALPGTNTTQIATTEFVTTGLDLKAPIESPALTGVPTAPTATAGDSSTKLATTEFVANAMGDFVGVTVDTITLKRKGAVEIPSGTEAERPAIPEGGALRYNSTDNTFEGFSNGAWSPLGGEAAEINQIQIGRSNNPDNNFVLAVPDIPDGTMKISRGNMGATTQDVLTVKTDGTIAQKTTAAQFFFTSF